MKSQNKVHSMTLKARLLRFLIVAGLGYLLFSYVLLPVRSPQGSSVKWHQQLELSFIFRGAYIFSSPERWDTVAIRTTGHSLVYLKKVLARPNESLLILGNSPFIDSKEIQVPVAPETIPYNIGEVQLQDDEFFVIPVSPEEEVTFTSFGIVKRDRIIGELLF